MKILICPLPVRVALISSFFFLDSITCHLFWTKAKQDSDKWHMMLCFCVAGSVTALLAIRVRIRLFWSGPSKWTQNLKQKGEHKFVKKAQLLNWIFPLTGLMMTKFASRTDNTSVMTINITWIDGFTERSCKSIFEASFFGSAARNRFRQTIWWWWLFVKMCYVQHWLHPSSPSLRCLCVPLDLLLGFVTDATYVCCPPKPLLQINISSFLDEKKRMWCCPLET